MVVASKLQLNGAHEIMLSARTVRRNISSRVDFLDLSFFVRAPHTFNTYIKDISDHTFICRRYL